MKLRIYFTSLLLCLGSFVHAAQPFPAAEIEAARSSIQAGDFSQAIQRLENVESSTESWEQHFWLGTAYLLDGRLDHAADAIDRALGLKADDPSIWVQRAVVEQEQGRFPVALQFLEIAADVDPAYAMTYLNAGQAYESLGNWDRARSAYGQFLKHSVQDSGNARMLRLRRDVLERMVAGETTPE